MKCPFGLTAMVAIPSRSGRGFASTERALSCESGSRPRIAPVRFRLGPAATIGRWILIVTSFGKRFSGSSINRKTAVRLSCRLRPNTRMFSSERSIRMSGTISIPHLTPREVSTAGNPKRTRSLPVRSPASIQPESKSTGTSRWTQTSQGAISLRALVVGLTPEPSVLKRDPPQSNGVF